ncbi:hypothetical protein SDRG_06942 [Saprolegnia diclina VS20]|uniref:WW domain-containing protein n=1 Tax=Saprolegnia diclina (strain VS20) TaxID=1156394 RepID=T0RT66_SAPDV|nr:hypothetical protein SDRG_06942 [Saprolegnia diclina VS20]EQC35658.1 hypothetical protein SDRG_06942 [Saprolegnia diclina VS20]|eukprot:XP_008610975.1 hypothetical protein SDRG_06942 [Saprolegnia diclina VS20]
MSPPTSAWVRHVDEDSNKAYYFNETTGETTWDEPKDFAAKAGGDGESGKKRKAEAIEDDDGCLWVKYIDPTTQKPYYSDMNSGKTQWEAPTFYTSDQGEDDDEEEDENIEEEYAFGAIADAPKPTPVADEKAPDYYRYIDATSNKPYFFNVHTKETTWEEPVDGVIKDGSAIASTEVVSGSAKYQEWMNKAAAAAANSSAAKAQSAATATAPTTSAPVASANDPVNRLNSILGNVGASGNTARWQQHYDTNTQRYYYHDSETGTTQWEVPTEGGIAAGNADWVPVDAQAAAANASIASRVGYDYSSTAGMSLVSGRFASAGLDNDYWAKAGVPSDKAGRQMSNFFDMTAFEANRAEAKRMKEALQKKNVDWKKVNAEKKRKRHRIRNKWMYED